MPYYTPDYFTSTLAALRMVLGIRVTNQFTTPTRQNAHMWIDRIQNELSPENLSHDGLLSRPTVDMKRRELLAALAHCRAILGITDPSVQDPGPADQFSGRHDQGSIHANRQQFVTRIRSKIATMRRKRNLERRKKLSAAMQDGFLVNTRVLLSNGTTGTITKINQTRMVVKGDDGCLWNAPPRCMTILKVLDYPGENNT